MTWWHAPLTRYQPPPTGLRPGAAVCFVDGAHTGTEDPRRPGWFRCEHPEGPVTWYGGAAPLPLSNGAAVSRETAETVRRIREGGQP
jgi:hypothetical protein